jgi:cytochrome c peroxidase
MLRPALILVFLLAGAPARGHAPAAPLAPGYGDLGYDLPEAGSYRLPPLTRAADGELLDSEGSDVRLHQLFGDRYALLGFIYTSCSDVNGCPLTAHVFYRLQQAMARDPVLARNLRLVSVSFDPQHDTPAVMRQYAGNFRRGRELGQWRFATGRSERELAPLLEAYAQDVQRRPATDGGPRPDFFHILRVFLIDPQRRVRNIYSASFLHADLVVRDLQTLLLEEQRGARHVNRGHAAGDPVSIRPGDPRSGYQGSDYRSGSLPLQARRGQPAQLLSFARDPPLGLPPLTLPAGLVLTPEKVALGRKLFFDRRLSLNNTFSCAMCHIPEHGFTNNELATAVGIEGRTVRRNAPSLYNVGYAARLFHDGREDRLAQQVWAPLLARNEMGNPAIGYVVNRIAGLADYSGTFEAAFAGEGPGMQNIGDALAAYQLTLNAADSPFDRWYFGGDETAISPQARRGFELFRGRAGCAGCHTVGKDHALFSDYAMHNTGVGYPASRPDDRETRPLQLAPGVFVEVDAALIRRVGEPATTDLGLYEITLNPDDRWKFRTPTLRNVALSAPYMHDGSLPTLRSVIEFYRAGGIDNPLLDPLLQPLELDPGEIGALVAFLEALTGSNVGALVADAIAAPVGDAGGVAPRGSPPGE